MAFGTRRLPYRKAWRLRFRPKEERKAPFSSLSLVFSPWPNRFLPHAVFPFAAFQEESFVPTIVELKVLFCVRKDGTHFSPPFVLASPVRKLRPPLVGGAGFQPLPITHPLPGVPPDAVAVRILRAGRGLHHRRVRLPLQRRPPQVGKVPAIVLFTFITSLCFAAFCLPPSR